MNRNDFNRFITEDTVPGTDDLAGIRELTDLFPWFHSAHLVLLHALKVNSDIKFETQLKNSALFVADREILYHYLYLKPEVSERESTVPQVVETEKVPEPVVNIDSGGEDTGDISLRSKEELIAEIESRLEEISVMPGIIQADQPVSVIEPLPEDNTAPGSYSEETVFEIELEPNFSARPSGTEETIETGDEELLELSSPEDEVTLKEEPHQQLTPDDLIERFIKANPRLERPAAVDTGPVKDLSEASAAEGSAFITETLARIYVNQGYYFKAINIYEKLTLKYPEKSAYFASRIEKIKELIK